MECDISLHGASSVTLHGTDCVIQGVTAYGTGCGGIDISGGDQVYICIFLRGYHKGRNHYLKCKFYSNAEFLSQFRTRYTLVYFYTLKLTPYGYNCNLSFLKGTLVVSVLIGYP